MTDSLDKFKDLELSKLIWDKFIINATELDDESKKVLYDNLWDLYITDEKND